MSDFRRGCMAAAVGVVGEGISGAAPHSGNYHTVPGNTYVLPTWLQKPEM